MSDKKVGESSGPEAKRNKSGSGAAPGKKRKPRAGDVGRALRSVYDQTLREEVPDDFINLLGKLS